MIVFYDKYRAAVKVLEDNLIESFNAAPTSLVERTTKDMFEAAGFEVQTSKPPRYSEYGP